MAARWCIVSSILALRSSHVAAQAAPPVPSWGGANAPLAPQPGNADPNKQNVRSQVEDAGAMAKVSRARPQGTPYRPGDAEQPTGILYDILPRELAPCSCACCAVTPRRDHERAPPKAPTPVPDPQQVIQPEDWAEHAANVAQYQAHVVAADEMACSPLYHEQQFQHENFAFCTEIAGTLGAFCKRDPLDVVGNTRNTQIDFVEFCYHECMPSFDKLENVGPGGECIPARMVTKVPEHWQEMSKAIADRAAKQQAAMMANQVNATVKRRRLLARPTAAPAE